MEGDMVTSMDVHPEGLERQQSSAGSLRIGDLGRSLTGPVLAAARAETYGNTHTMLAWVMPCTMLLLTATRGPRFAPPVVVSDSIGARQNQVS